MALRPRSSCLPGLIVAGALVALPAHAASPPPPNLAVVDPTQRTLFDQLFLEAQGPQPSFARELLPGHADEHLSWFPLQYLVPLANSSTAAAPIPGYPIVTKGVIQTPPVTLGRTQGTGTAAGAQSPSGDACYLAEGNTDNLAAYSVDLATSLFTNVSGAPFATDGNPDGMVVEPSGRFLYVANGDGQTVTEYSINIATRALTKIGTMPTSATHPAAINATRQCVFVANLVDGGYEVFAINSTNGTLGSVPGSPFGTNTAYSIARTLDGNFVYFSVVAATGEIDGFFVEPNTCALTPVPGSPFFGPGLALVRANVDVPVLYSVGTGSVQAFAINPATGTLSPLGAEVSIGADVDTGAFVVGPKGFFLHLSDQFSGHLRTIGLDPATGGLKASGAPIAGPANVQSMLLLSENGDQLVGQGIAQNRTQRTLGGAPPYTYALIGGALPPGLHFNDGAITGTSTTLGKSNFDVLVTDAVGATSSGVRSLEVVAPPAAPAAPSNLAAIATSPTEVSLSWQDNANQTAAFQVSLSQDGGPFLEVQAEAPLATTAVVTNLSPATSYTFRIRAQNAAGGATDATTVTLTTPALSPVGCTPTANGQCLLGNRFLLEAIYQDSHGNAGLANVVQITTDTSYLWFFSSSNVEVVVKVLDGCALGGHFWVFAGGLTNVHVILRLTDTQTGAVRYYEVPFGPPFTPIQDTSAFGTCASAKAAPDAGAAAMPAMTAQALRESAIADVEARLRTVAAAKLPARAEEPAAGVGCSPSQTTLCLNNNRFQVSATFNAGAAGSGTAHVGSLTSDTGYLWFFSSSNVEAIIKVLNGCGLSSTYWVFAGGLTNVQVTITVTDTLTGFSHQYNNPANTTFEPVQDTGTFKTCP
ncbi:MAG TPA: beta-propeller fold lactonase family protein [Thermoanaerobaculia bacterium]